MSNSQQDVTREVLLSVRDFLGGPKPAGDEWCFEFGEHLNSNWGAVYGGALAAGMLAVAREAAPDRSPRSLHIQMIRSVAGGLGYATADVRHAGRTVATVEVDLYDARHKLAAIALVTTVTPEAVDTEHENVNATPFKLRTTSIEIAEAFLAPVQRSLHLVGEGVDGGYVVHFGENVRPSVDGAMAPVMNLTVPWDNLDSTGPEVACLAADPMVAGAVMQTFVPNEALGPNPDLSLRFTSAPAARVVYASGTMMSVQNGTAIVALEVQAGAQQLAHGLSTSLLLAPR
jgi:acyl-coenzyme A thioesterase PaaI-like protein